MRLGGLSATARVQQSRGVAARVPATHVPQRGMSQMFMVVIWGGVALVAAALLIAFGTLLRRRREHLTDCESSPAGC